MKSNFSFWFMMVFMTLLSIAGTVITIAAITYAITVILPLLPLA